MRPFTGKPPTFSQWQKLLGIKSKPIKVKQPPEGLIQDPAPVLPTKEESPQQDQDLSTEEKTQEEECAPSPQEDSLCKYKLMQDTDKSTSSPIVNRIRRGVQKS